VGKSTVVSNLIFGARHSLATQSEAGGFTPGCTHDDERNRAVNVHGCGIGWYSLRPGSGLVDGYGLSSYERPAIYRTTAAPSHDRNLRSLAKMIETGLLFGHVRAAGPGASVHEVRPARGAQSFPPDDPVRRVALCARSTTATRSRAAATSSCTTATCTASPRSGARCLSGCATASSSGSPAQQTLSSSLRCS
jgi:hypothetical protein